jgi:RNase P/RNase MRP subunit POP5
MVVKEGNGRRRYIVFDVSPEITKESLIKRLRSAGSDPPYIIQCVPGKAVLRCSPKEKDDVIDVMARADPASVPLITSGTLRTVRGRYPELKTPKKRRKI